MSEDEYEVATPRFFVTKLNGVMKQNEQREKAEWERARWIAQRVNTPYMKRVPGGWWNLPWDNDGFEKWDLDQWREFNAYADKIHPKKLMN